MDAKTKARIANEEQARFLDSQFGQLDMSGSPDLSQPATEKFEEQDKYGLSRVDTSGLPVINQLKDFVSNPDQSTLERIADETGNPDLQAELIDIKEEQVAQEFLKTHPTYYRADGNYEAIREWLTENGLPFDGSSLHKAFVALSRAGELEMAPGTAKPLSTDEQLYVISLCKNGQIDGAITQYLAYALPEMEETWENAEEFLSDPNTLRVRNDACAFVWFHSRPVQDSREWQAFKRNYFRLRPIVTVSDLDFAWRAFQDEQKALARDRVIYGEREQTPQGPVDVQHDLDSLDDGQIDDLYHKSLRAYAQSAKRSSGVLA